MVIWDGCQHVTKNCKTIDLRGAQVKYKTLDIPGPTCVLDDYDEVYL